MKQRDNEAALVQRRKNQALLVLCAIDGERGGFLTDLGRVASRKIIKQAGLSGCWVVDLVGLVR